MKRFSENEKQQCSRIVLYTQRIFFWKGTINSSTAFRCLQLPGAGLSPGEEESECVCVCGGVGAPGCLAPGLGFILGEVKSEGLTGIHAWNVKFLLSKKYQLDPQKSARGPLILHIFYCFFSLGFTSRKLTKHPCLYLVSTYCFQQKFPFLITLSAQSCWKDPSPVLSHQGGLESP